EGRAAWQRFTADHAAERNAANFPPHLQGPWAKLTVYAARFALLLSYMRWATGENTGETGEKEADARANALPTADGQVLVLTKAAGSEAPQEVVSGQDMAGAVRLVAYFKSHARRTYPEIDVASRMRDARRALRWLIRKFDSFTDEATGSRSVSKREIH